MTDHGPWGDPERCTLPDPPQPRDPRWQWVRFVAVLVIFSPLIAVSLALWTVQRLFELGAVAVEWVGGVIADPVVKTQFALGARMPNRHDRRRWEAYQAEQASKGGDN